MNKFISTVKASFPLFVLAVTLVLLFMPLPVKLIQVMMILNLVFSLCLFLTKFLSNPTIAFYFPRLILYFCIFTCALIIAATRTFLTVSSLEEQIPLVLIIGQWICRENIICGFFTTLSLCASLLVFCKKCVSRFQEVAARFCLDAMNQKMFDIEHQLEQKMITVEEGKILKEKIRNEADLYSSTDGAAKFLFGTMGAFLVLYVIAVAGGVAVGILERNMYWKDALKQYIMLSSGYMVLFVVPLFLASLGFKISAK